MKPLVCVVMNEEVVLMYDYQDTLRYVYRWPFTPNEIRDPMDLLKTFLEQFESDPTVFEKVDLAKIPAEWVTVQSLTEKGAGVDFHLP